MVERTLRLGIDGRQAERGERVVSRSLDTIKSKSRQTVAGVGRLEGGFERLRRAAFSLRGVLASLGIALGGGAIIRSLIRTNREYERLVAQLHTVQGSAEAAQRAFKGIEDLASSTPFQIENLTQAFVALRVRGAEPTADQLTALGNLASSFSRDITDVAYAVSSAQEGMTRPLRGLGFEASVAGNQVTLAFQGAQMTVERSTQAIIEAIIELSGATFAGAMEREMNTLNGAISNLQDNIGTLMRGIGDAGLTGVITDATGSVRDFTGAVGDNQVAIGTTMNVLLGFGQAVVGVLTAIPHMGARVMSLVANTIAAGIGGLVIGVQEMLNAAIRQVNRFGDWLSGAMPGVTFAPAGEFDTRGQRARLRDVTGWMADDFGALRSHAEFVGSGFDRMANAAERAREAVRNMRGDLSPDGGGGGGGGGGGVLAAMGVLPRPRVVGDQWDWDTTHANLEARRRQREEFARLGGTLQPATGPTLSAAGPSAGAPGFIERFRGGLEGATEALKERLTPAMLAGSALFMALMPVVRGFREAIGDGMDALMHPLRETGRILGTAILPLLRLLWPILQGFGVGVGVITELMLRVVEGWAKAIGHVIRAIGRAIDLIPFVSGGPIIRAGQSIIDFGESTSRSADEIHSAWRDLAGMKFDETARGLERFNDALLNAPRAFNLALLRHQAGAGGAGGGVTPPRDRDVRPPVVNRFEAGSITIQARDRTMDEALDDLDRAVARRAARGGTTRLNLAVRAA